MNLRYNILIFFKKGFSLGEKRNMDRVKKGTWLTYFEMKLSLDLYFLQALSAN